MLSCVRARLAIPAMFCSSPTLVTASRFASSASSPRPWFQKSLQSKLAKNLEIPEYMFLPVLQESTSPKLIEHVCGKIDECNDDADFEDRFCSEKMASAFLRCLPHATTLSTHRILLEAIYDVQYHSNCLEKRLANGTQDEIKLLLKALCRRCYNQDHDVVTATCTLRNLNTGRGFGCSHKLLFKDAVPFIEKLICRSMGLATASSNMSDFIANLIERDRKKAYELFANKKFIAIFKKLQSSTESFTTSLRLLEKAMKRQRREAVKAAKAKEKEEKANEAAKCAQEDELKAREMEIKKKEEANEAKEQENNAMEDELNKKDEANKVKEEEIKTKEEAIKAREAELNTLEEKKNLVENNKADSDAEPKSDVKKGISSSGQIEILAMQENLTKIQQKIAELTSCLENKESDNK